jgi:hypothetical protein
VVYSASEFSEAVVYSADEFSAVAYSVDWNKYSGKSLSCSVRSFGLKKFNPEEEQQE